VLIEPEEIAAIKPESKQTIDLVQFADAKEIDYRYFERPQFPATKWLVKLLRLARSQEEPRHPPGGNGHVETVPHRGGKESPESRDSIR
jgi:hypothetical protein